VKQHGNARLPRNYVTPDDFNLGIWVSHQRQKKPKNCLNQDRIDRLEALPWWSWDPFTEQWEEGFEQLRSYVNMNGNARVPARYVTPDGLNLGNWVNNQRQNKPQNLLSQDRIERLEALPGWSWDPISEQWEEAFGQLQSYVNLNSHAMVPLRYVTPDDFKLGSWVSHQRTNKPQNLLSQDRIERLEALPRVVLGSHYGTMGRSIRTTSVLCGAAWQCKGSHYLCYR